MLNILQVSKKLYLTERLVQRSRDFKYCTVTSLAVKSVMDIFRQVLQNFQNTAVFKTIFKKKFC